MKSPFTKTTQLRTTDAQSVITAYDFPSAKLCEQAGVNAILVGDSLANVVLGYGSTRDIGMVEMEIFTAAVNRGAKNTHVISDLPYGSDMDPTNTLQNARKLIDAGADSVKLEGAKFDEIAVLVNANIPVVAHLGLTPQTATNYKQVGRNAQEKERLIRDSQRVSELGVIAVVLEHIPSELAKEITDLISAPTIGIGAGVDTDAQVMVYHDVLGLMGAYVPPIAHSFVQTHQVIVDGIRSYHQWVISRTELSQIKK